MPRRCEERTPRGAPREWSGVTACPLLYALHRGGKQRRPRGSRGVGPYRLCDELELRAARRRCRRASEVPPNAARTDRVFRDQLRAAAATTRSAFALRGSSRTVDCARDYVTALRSSPSRRAGQPSIAQDHCRDRTGMRRGTSRAPPKNGCVRPTHGVRAAGRFVRLAPVQLQSSTA